MASASLKHAFADALASYLATATGLTCIAEAADPEQKMKEPHLQVIPHKMRFMPFVDEIVSGDDDTMDEVVTGSNHDMIVELGEFEGPIELRLVAKSLPERERYQAAVLSALNGEDERPGVTPLQVASVPFFQAVGGDVVSNYTANGSVMLDDEDWVEEFAWSKHRFAFLEVQAQFPLLVLRRSVSNIEELILAVTNDMDTEPVSAIPADQVESVQISDDGSISQP